MGADREGLLQEPGGVLERLGALQIEVFMKGNSVFLMVLAAVCLALQSYQWPEIKHGKYDWK